MKYARHKERQALVSSVRTFWASLDTHLDWVIRRNPKGADSRRFHVETAIEYAEAVLKALKALR